MNNAEVIRSYLVSLGFSVDTSTQRKFDSALKDAVSTVEKSTSGIAKSMLGWQTAITGAFSAISAGVLGLIDKTAQAELGYQNFGVQMLMSAEDAKKFKIALDAVGMSLDELAWNPEGLRQFRDIRALEDNLQSTLGTDYQQQLQYMFRVTEQFRMLRVEFLYLQQGVAAGLIKALGGEDFVKRLQAINDWIVQNGPKIVDWITKNVAPIFKDWEGIVKDLVGLFQDLGTTFTNLIGLLSGDTSIEGTQFDFEKLGKAVQHVIHWFSEFVEWIILAERMLVHFADAAELALSGIGAAMSGHMETARKLFEDARKEFRAGVGDITVGSAGILGGATAGAITGAELGSVIPGVGTVIGGLLGAGAGATAGAAGMTIATDRWATENQKRGGEHGFYKPSSNPSINHDLAEQARGLAIEISAKTGVPADLIWAQWAHETNNFTSRLAVQQNNLGGIKYPGTEIYRNFDSLQDYADYYMNGILGNKRYVNQGILQAQTPEDYAAALKRGGYFGDSLETYVRGMKHFDSQFLEGRAQPGDTTLHIEVGGIHINQPNASKEQIQEAVSHGIRDAISKQSQTDLVNMRGVYANGY